MVRAMRSSLSELASMRSFGDRAYPPAMKVDEGGGRDPAGPVRAPPPQDVAPELAPPLRPRVRRTRGAHGLLERRGLEAPDLFARAKP
jgi:hypothetical protein